MTRAFAETVRRGLGLLLLLAVVHPSAASAADDELRVVHEAALTLYDRGEYADALLGFNRSYAISPLPQSLMMIGRCYQALARFDEAESAFEKLLVEYPDDPLVSRVRLHLIEASRDGGAEKLGAGDYLRAKLSFEKALLLIAMVGKDAAASRPVVVVGLGEAFLGMKEWEKARERFREVEAPGSDEVTRKRAASGLERAEAALEAERAARLADRSAAMVAAVDYERASKALDEELELRSSGRRRGYVFMSIGASLAVLSVALGLVASCYRGCGGPPWEVRESSLGYVVVLLPVAANIGFSIAGTLIYVNNQVRLGKLRAKRKAMGPPPVPTEVSAGAPASAPASAPAAE